MPVSLTISAGIVRPGFIKVENSSTISKPFNFTAPISIISFELGVRPVVSRSKTTNSTSCKLTSFHLLSSSLSTIGIPSFIK